MSDKLRIAKDMYDQVKRFYDLIKPAVQATKEIVRSLDAATRAAKGQQILSDNKIILQSYALAQVYLDMLRPAERRGVNEWIEWSGINLLESETWRPALIKLREIKEKAPKLKEAFRAHALMLKVTRISDNMDVKSRVLNAYVPSLIALEEIDRLETIKSWEALERITERILKDVTKAIDTIESFLDSKRLNELM
ncbi:MAG: hypothetical protein ACRENG_05020 [bacterium]